MVNSALKGSEFCARVRRVTRTAIREPANRIVSNAKGQRFLKAVLKCAFVISIPPKMYDKLTACRFCERATSCQLVIHQRTPFYTRQIFPLLMLSGRWGP